MSYPQKSWEIYKINVYIYIIIQMRHFCFSSEFRLVFFSDMLDG